MFFRREWIKLTHKTKTVVARVETEMETEMGNIKTNNKMAEDKVQKNDSKICLIYQNKNNNNDNKLKLLLMK